tara:strand:+ start:329 stop:622 length:294 start_codon:yes stop_codon:yes gene_type:complete
MGLIFSFSIKKYMAKIIVIIEKSKIKLEVFKLTANIVPRTTPIITKTPKVLTILKSTDLNFICVIADIIDVGIIIEKDVPKAKCITNVCSMPTKLNT